MKPIQIYTSDFQFLAEIDDYESLQFTRRSQKPGDFELHINLNKNNTEYLQLDNLVYLGPKKVGVIQHKEITRENTDELLIKGYTLQGLLGERLTIPPVGKANDTIKGPLETVMKHYVMMNAIQPTDPTRKIQNLVIADDLGRGPIVESSSRNKRLDEELTRLSVDGFGWEIYVDLESRQFVFEILEGIDLTAGQDINPPVIFSPDFDNLKRQVFIESTIGNKNMAYVGGQGEGEARRIIELGSGNSGLKRKEVFIDARDIDDDNLLPLRGIEKLNELQKVIAFESQILTYGPFIYEQDWDLGDMVTVQDNKLGLTMDTPIIEVKEIYETSGFQLEATFGSNVPTVIDKIKNTINAPMVEKPLKTPVSTNAPTNPAPGDFWYKEV